jgi:hAT family C-terminal dimerisation region
VAILSRLRKVGLSSSRVLAITKDNGSNVKALGSLRLFSIAMDCFCHTLQLSIKECIYGRKRFNEGGIKLLVALIKRAGGLVGFLRSSPKAMHELASVCVRLGVKVKKPQAAVDTRWDSEYRMLQVVVMLWDVIKTMWAEQTLPLKSDTGKTSYVLNELDMIVVKQLVAVLGRAEQLTRSLEGTSYVTITDAYVDLSNFIAFLLEPTLDATESGVEGMEDVWPSARVHASIKRLKMLLIRSIKTRFPFIDKRQPMSAWSDAERESFRPLLIAMALHPAISRSLTELDAPSLVAESSSADEDKKMRAVRRLGECRDSMVKYAKEYLVQAIMELYRDEKGRPVRREGGSPTSQAVSSSASNGRGGGAGGGETRSKKKSKFSKARSRSAAVDGAAALAGAAVGAAAGGPEDEECPYAALHRRATAEVDSFWGAKEVDEETEVLDMWRDTWSKSYPLLAIVQRAYHAIPPSSAGSECLFSRGGAVIDPRRSSFMPATASRVVLIHDNSHPCLLDTSGYSTERASSGKRKRSASCTAWRPSRRKGKQELDQERKQRKELEAKEIAEEAEEAKADPSARLKGVEDALGAIICEASLSVAQAGEQQAAEPEDERIAVPSAELVTMGEGSTEEEARETFEDTTRGESTEDDYAEVVAMDDDI